MIYVLTIKFEDPRITDRVLYYQTAEMREDMMRLHGTCDTNTRYFLEIPKVWYGKGIALSYEKKNIQFEEEKVDQ